MAATITGLCESCTQGYRLPGEPTGELTAVGALNTYFRSAPTAATTPKEKKAIVILTDAFGLPVPNAQIIADKLVERLGVDAYVPDIFDGASEKLPWLLVV
jgi:carboxymethylenebutenolidase